MRDIFVLIVVLGSMPAILMQPYIGVLVWSWISYMNPHRLAWGFAANFPFAMIIAITTIIALLFSKESKKIIWTREVVVLVFFILWMFITTFFAQNYDLAWLHMEKVLKIQFMVFVTLMIMGSRDRLNWLVWVIVFSLGFYGIKGGIFTITSGGGYHVRGPNGTFIGGNNEIGLAMVMVIPLMRYVQLQAKKTWLRLGLGGGMILTVIAVLGTQSRGALLGLVAMGLMLLLKTRKAALLFLLAIVTLPLVLNFMPQSWYDRMETIETYNQDRSALERIAAWKFAINTAMAHPLTGGGFEVFAGHTDAHSIYFEVLGEHGFIGLMIFLILGWFTWRTGGWIKKQAKERESLSWGADLVSMLQVSLIGYAVSGAFLGLAYFDLYYHLVAIMVLTKVLVIKHLADDSGKAGEPVSGGDNQSRLR